MIKNIFKFISFIFRNLEVLLCIRKTPYKTHTFPKKNARYEYYYNKEKFKQMYA